MNTQHKIIHGDSRNMSDIHDESIHLVITSPPYWQLKDYGTDTQIGFHDSYEEYINNLNLVWKECYRVLHKGCKLCINIGDQFARAAYYGRYKVIPIRQEIIKFCEAIGLDYMGAIIWKKVTNSHSSGGGVQMGSYPFPRNGILKIDYEFILVFKKLGSAPKPSKEQKEQSKMTPEEWNTYFAGHWQFSGAKQDKHIAMFPEELPKRLIKMFSFVGETVLDPFAGSGTTSLAALQENRHSMGYEINPNFLPILTEKIKNSSKLISKAQLQIVKQKSFLLNYTEAMQSMPYVFKDPHTLDKKINIKEKTYGSVIDAQGKRNTQALFQVTGIISATELMLSNKQKIKLLGLQVASKHKAKAMAFLEQKTKGKKVFFKTDTDHPLDSVYLYLENKTFINAHLIKQGLASVSKKIDFKHKQRFVKYEQETK